MTEFRVVRYIYCTSDDYDSSMIKYYSFHGNTPAINQLRQIDILNIRHTKLYQYFENS